MTIAACVVGEDDVFQRGVAKNAASYVCAIAGEGAVRDSQRAVAKYRATVGVFRKIPFGQGIVDFDAAFRTLHRIGFTGPFMVEMWNEEAPDAEAQVAVARQWLLRKLEAASAGA